MLWLGWLLVILAILVIGVPVLLTLIGIGFHIVVIILGLVLVLFLILLVIAAIWAFIFLRKMRYNMKQAQENGEEFIFNTKTTTFHFNGDDAFVNENERHRNGIKDVTPKDQD
jgi:ABC-type transport system involved in cytochrome bd biosynthesis fused ATPase/permease subunit